jgi:signal transduction histidine kinase
LSQTASSFPAARASATAQNEPAALRRLIRLRLDLHDGPMQDLVACGFELDLLRRELDALQVDTSEARRALENAMRQLGEIERALRSFAADRTTVEPTSIVDVVDNEIARFAQWNGARVELELTGDVEPATDSQRIALQSVLREALTNIARHADATEVRVELYEADGVIYLSVRDNGKGCEPAAAGLDADGRAHLGLAGMQERLELLDGTLIFPSRPGGPTTVTAALRRWHPLRELAAAKRPARKKTAPGRLRGAIALKVKPSADDR